MGLFDIFSNKNAQDAANAKIAGINQGYNSATGAVQTGIDSANNYYNSAGNAWQTLMGQGNQAGSAYADALGLNGPDGNARAKTAFQSNPGYQFAQDMTTQATDRGAAARGMVASGNTINAEQTNANNLANQQWSSYLNSFSPLLNQQTAATAGLSGTLGNQANINYLGNSQIGQYGWQQGTGIGDAQAAADLAKNSASANLWNVLMGGTALGSNMLGFNSGGLGKLLGLTTSDARAKEDIEPIGKLVDGKTVYSFRYKGDAHPHIGLIAQEVEKTDPQAVVEIGGVKRVHYGMATERARHMVKFSDAFRMAA